jgi:hypothetical protein
MSNEIENSKKDSLKNIKTELSQEVKKFSKQFESDQKKLEEKSATFVHYLNNYEKYIATLNLTVKTLQENVENAENLLNNFIDQFNRSIEAIEKTEANLIESNEKVIGNTTIAISNFSEETKESVKKIAKEFSEAKSRMEVEILQGKLREAECSKALELTEAKHLNDKFILEQKIKDLEGKFENEKLQLKLENSEKLIKMQQKIDETIDQKMNDFKNELMNEFRP